MGIDAQHVHLGPYSFPHGGAVRDFPARTPLMPEELKAVVPAHYITEIIERVLPASTDDADEPGLGGVHLDFDEGLAIATDRARLHLLHLGEMRVEAKGTYRARPAVTLTRAFFEYLQAVVNREWIGLVVADKLVTAFGDDFGAIARPLEQSFPGWRKAIPSYAGYWVSDKEAFLQMLDEAQPLERTHVHLSVDSIAEKLLVSARSADGDAYKNSVTAHRQGGPASVRVALDPQYLREAIEATAGGLIRLGFEHERSETQPITVRGEDDDFLAVVMPCKGDQS